MMDICYSPEQPTVVISSQKLYNNVSVLMASYEDCNLYVAGSMYAEPGYMDADDTFLVGNYDLGLATATLIDLYAEDGNITDFAACGVFESCPLMSTKDGTNKTGQIWMKFCVGGANLDYAAWGFDATN